MSILWHSIFSYLSGAWHFTFFSTSSSRTHHQRYQCETPTSHPNNMKGINIGYVGRKMGLYPAYSVLLPVMTEMIQDGLTVIKSSQHLKNSLKCIKAVHWIILSTEGKERNVRRWGNGDVCSIKDLYCGFSKLFTDYSHIFHISLSYTFPISSSFVSSVVSTFNSSILNS